MALKSLIKLGAASLIFALPMSTLGAEVGETLMKGSDCFSCHAVGRKVIGPSYLDVAKKYKGNAGAVKLLVKKVKEGGSGVWGAVPMAGHPTLSESDIEKMVKWVLSRTPALVAAEAAAAAKAAAAAAAPAPEHAKAHAEGDAKSKKHKKRHVSHLASHAHEDPFAVDSDAQLRKLMEKQDCYGCHAGIRRDGVADEINGWPSFVKIEARYKNSSNLLPLVKKIRSGEGEQIWGKIPHPRYEQIPAEALEKMLAYIVAGKASKGVESIDPNKMSAEEWMRKGSDCFSCHAINTKNVGPAYKDVAKKYAGAGSAQIKALVKKVKEGGVGVWGTAAMTAHPSASDTQLEKSVRWILEQK